MSAIPVLTEEEKYLAAIFDDPSGIELAELLWTDEEQPDRCFRVWDFQLSWYHNEETYQIDLAGRSLGKSMGIMMRAFAFPFNYPGAEMLITAPELNHLRPVTDKIENMIYANRLTRELLPSQRGNGINHQPQFQVRFINNARIISRLPNRDGRGVKGSTDVNSIVLTRRGLIPAKDVVVGDVVFTHMRRWRSVVKTHHYDVECVAVKGGGLREIVVSENHRFWARRNRNPQRTRNLVSAQWVIVDDGELDRMYWASPLVLDPFEEVPELPCPPGLERAFMWLAGRYVADGALGGTAHDGSRTHVAFTDDECGIQAVEKVAGLLGRSVTRRRHDNAVCGVLNGRELAQFLDDQFGHRAEGKRLPMWLFGQPTLASAFLEGYLGGDGYRNDDKKRWEMSTASKPLAVGLRLLGQSLGWAAALSWTDPKVTHICGVSLKKAPQRSWRVHFSEHGGTQIVDGDMAWAKMRTPVPVGVRPVVDLVVDEDYSYVADGIVHMGGL